MLFCALASDYDGTLARDGKTDEPTRTALRNLKAAGKRLILLTGRKLDDLTRVFDCFDYFDVVVAENGAVLYLSASREERMLAEAPPEPFIAALRAKQVDPLSVGRSIVATWSPNEGAVLETIRELELDWQLSFNKGAVMCLPPGVNKGSGLAAALEELKLSPHNVVGVGDAENDQAFLSVCGCRVAVANALEVVKDGADIQTRAARGAGVSELVERWLSDPAELFSGVRRHDLYLGESILEGTAVSLPADRGAVLITGSSGVGKTSLTRLLVERMAAGAYQTCIVDPEGDYLDLKNVTHLGSPERAPAVDEVLSVLASPGPGVAVNLLSIDLPDRPAYFGNLLGQVGGLRAITGRPHWLVLDEAHHLSPSTQDAQHTPLPDKLSSAVFITTKPQQLSRSVLGSVRIIVSVGDTAMQALDDFGRAVGEPVPASNGLADEHSVLVWDRTCGLPPRAVAVGKAKGHHRRHTRKYAEGRLGEDKSFYFRGPQGTLNLRAFNLATFLQLAEGVDDATWLFHLGRGDYARWFREAIKDEQLATEAQAAESSQDPARSRAQIGAAVRRRYAAS